VICQRSAAGTAKVPLCDVRAHEGRRASARPAQVFAPDTHERHERLTGCPLAHPAMAKARVLRRREQLIAHGSALTAASPLGRVFLDYSHVVFPMFNVDPVHRSNMWGAPSNGGDAPFGILLSRSEELDLSISGPVFPSKADVSTDLGNYPRYSGLCGLSRECLS